MKKRTLAIINELIANKDTCTIAGLAEQFSVSQRTIRNDLNDISGILRENGKEELTLAGGGKILCADDFDSIRQFTAEEDLYSYKLSKEERVRIAAAFLVNSSEYITLSTIAENLFVSRATVINDLNEIKDYIAKGNLEVLSHPNKGLRVEGKESDKRLFLMRLSNENTQSKHTDMAVRRRNQTSKYLMAQDILKYISQYCHTNTTEDEVQFLSELLGMAHYFRNASNKKDAPKVRDTIKRYTGRDFTKEDAAYVAVHVCAALERRKNKEIAFHVIVACHAGIGTSQLLLEKLKKHFNFQDGISCRTKDEDKRECILKKENG